MTKSEIIERLMTARTPEECQSALDAANDWEKQNGFDPDVADATEQPSMILTA